MKMKKLISIMMTVLLLCLAAFPAMAEGAAQAIDLTGHIVILHTNDSHGRVDTNLGFSRVAYAKNTLEGAGATVLLLDAGDALHGLPFANISAGEAVVRLMNAAGYDAMTVGNHDFNYGHQRLAELSGMAEFPMLASNVVKEDGSLLLSGSVVLEMNSVKFGILGLATPETMYKTSPDNVEGLTFTDPIEAAKENVAALEAENCTLIIALTHLGLDEGSEITSKMLAEQVPGIDVIVDGHSHTLLEEGMWVNGTLIVSAGEYIENIGCVDIDPSGVTAATLLTGEDLGAAEGDEAVQALVAEIAAAQEEQLNVKVGSAAVDLVGERALVRTSETNLGNFAADAIRGATGAEIALINGGGIRDSIPAGDVTKKQLAMVFPFGNYAVLMEVTGQQLLDALEHGVSLYPAEDGRFPQVSGMSFKFDPAQSAGSRVFDVKVNGEVLEAERVYTLATNDYMATGGDEYPLTDTPLTGEFDSLEEMLIAYMESFGTPIEPGIEGRIVMEAKPAE